MTRIQAFKSKAMNHFIKTVFSLFATSSFFAQSNELSVLFIGNSYTHMNDMPKLFDKLCKAEGLKVHVEKSAQSGASFQIHSERKDMYEAIASRKWDYVILQGYSRELTWNSNHIDTATIPYLNKILASIDESSPNASKLFYMTWGYENGFQEREEVNTFLKMADTIEKGYRYLGQKYNFPVVPVGMVWKSVKQDSVIDLYASDRAHPSQNGSYLIANTFFQSIFGIPARPDLGIIDENDATLIREKVNEVLLEKRAEYGLDKETFFIDGKIEKDSSGVEQYRLDYAANFPDASRILWDFGNKKSRKWKGNHYYDSLGIHTVQVTIEFEDGDTRTLSKEVRIDALDNRRRRKKWFQFWRKD